MPPALVAERPPGADLGNFTIKPPALELPERVVLQTFEGVVCQQRTAIFNKPEGATFIRIGDDIFLPRIHSSIEGSVHVPYHLNQTVRFDGYVHWGEIHITKWHSAE